MRVKICGITNLQDAQHASSLGAWALGFNFFNKSPRFVSPQVAGEIVQRLDSNLLKVGVFVNASPQDVHKIYKNVGLDIVQLHGDETPEYCRKLQLPIIKALRPSMHTSRAWLRRWQKVEALLIDHYSQATFGGSGQLADWEFAKHASQHFKTLLAGGLRAENCLAAIKIVKPYAIDVCSGVEAYPGKKSAKKLQVFFQTMKQYENDHGERRLFW